MSDDAARAREIIEMHVRQAFANHDLASLVDKIAGAIETAEARGRLAGIEEAARLVERYYEAEGMAGKYLSRRLKGPRAGDPYAVAIRALHDKKAQP